MASNGVIYAMPQQAERVLRIEPGPALGLGGIPPDHKPAAPPEVDPQSQGQGENHKG